MPQPVSPTFRNLKGRWGGRLLDALFAAWALMAVVRLFRAGESNDEDFRVYYRAAHEFAAHANPYAFTAADQGFVFKYLPWFLPLFYPLSHLNWEQGRWAWYGVQLACLVYSLVWIFGKSARIGVPARLTAACAASYWWLWHSHFSAGQFAAVILAVGLWASPARATPLRLAALNLILTSKFFSVLSAFGHWRAQLRLQALAASLALLLALNVLLLVLSPIPLADLYSSWWHAALSGGEQLKEEAIRGQGNNGLTVFFMRILQVPASATRVDIGTALGLGALLAVVWARVSRPLRDFERWSGWLALGAVIHPLAWHHSFVVVQPLSTFAVARAWQSGNRGYLGGAILGLACVALLVPQVIGTGLARYAELGSFKAWGTLLSAGILVACARRDQNP